MKYILIASALFISINSLAQNASKRCNCKFQSINNVGIVEGSDGSGFQLHSLNGVAINKWFMGIGAGVDYYRFRSLPLYIESRREFLNKNINPFLYAAAGIHFPWKREDETFYYNADVSGGLYYDAGIGLHFSTSKTNGLTISAGYSFKHITESVRTVPYCIMGPCPEFEQKREYGLKRISMKVGWRFRSA